MPALVYCTMTGLVVGVPVAVPGQQVTWLRDQGVGGDEFKCINAYYEITQVHG